MPLTFVGGMVFSSLDLFSHPIGLPMTTEKVHPPARKLLSMIPLGVGHFLR